MAKESESNSSNAETEDKKKPINKQYLRGHLIGEPTPKPNGNVMIVVIEDNPKAEAKNIEPERFKIELYNEGADKAMDLTAGSKIETFGYVGVEISDMDKGYFVNETIYSAGFKELTEDDKPMMKYSNHREFSGYVAGEIEFKKYGKNNENLLAKYTIMQNVPVKEGAEKKTLVMKYVAFGVHAKTLQNQKVGTGDLLTAKGPVSTQRYHSDKYNKDVVSKSVIQNEVYVHFQKSKDQTKEQTETKSKNEAPKVTSEVKKTASKAKKKGKGVTH